MQFLADNWYTFIRKTSCRNKIDERNVPQKILLYLSGPQLRPDRISHPKNTAAEKTTSAVVFFVVQERYHENFVIYDKDLCKHWKNGFFCDKIDRKSVLWTHTSQTVTGKREREKVEFMSLAVVTLKKGEGRFLKSGGLWVYDNEIASIMGSFVNGDIVLVRDFDGYPMGRGFINTNSKITVRMLTRD